jgi:hypothetical protein
MGAFWRALQIHAVAMEGGELTLAGALPKQGSNGGAEPQREPVPQLSGALVRAQGSRAEGVDKGVVASRQR